MEHFISMKLSQKMVLEFENIPTMRKFIVSNLWMNFCF